ncbi:MAG: hypothetical protein GVY07_16655 [Bacteroidetes bacterium]|jgi:hypothetical protein|nr:hypothetical protein [Bacteroidota bacterium]
MIFKSSEIRWWSTDKDILWEFYEKLPKKGEGNREPDRKDYYLESHTINTGIKIREGNHELKVKRAKDEELDFGMMEHWIKWSTSEERNILNTVDNQLLDDWISVKKERFKKTYKIINQNEIEYVREGFPAEGCGAEFTKIQVQESEKTIYTVGLEAFSSSNRERKNLLNLIEQLDLDFSFFRKKDSYGYPDFLQRYDKKSK